MSPFTPMSPFPSPRKSLTIAGKNSLSLKGYPSTFVIDGKRAVTFARISKSHGGRAKAEEVLKVLTGRQP